MCVYIYGDDSMSLTGLNGSFLGLVLICFDLCIWMTGVNPGRGGIWFPTEMNTCAFFLACVTFEAMFTSARRVHVFMFEDEIARFVGQWMIVVSITPEKSQSFGSGFQGEMAMDVIIWTPQDIHWKVIETRETPINSPFSAHPMLCFEILLLVNTEESIHQPLEIVNAGPSLRCFPKDQTPTLVHQHLSNQAAFQSRIRIRKNGLLLLHATTHVGWGSSNFDPPTITATSHYRWFYGGVLGSPASKGYSGYSHLNSTP